MKTLFRAVLLVACLVRAVSAQAQIVIAPTGANFTATAADFANTLSYQFDLFACTSVTAGPPALCVGQSATAFGTGIVVPVASVVPLVPPDAFGNNYTFPLNVAPVLAFLQSTPAGVGYVATIIANGNPATGSLNSPRSAASNPFSPGRSLAGVTTVRVR
jgi:hypothetical protein